MRPISSFVMKGLDVLGFLEVSQLSYKKLVPFQVAQLASMIFKEGQEAKLYANFHIFRPKFWGV